MRHGRIWGKKKMKEGKAVGKERRKVDGREGGREEKYEEVGQESL